MSQCVSVHQNIVDKFKDECKRQKNSPCVKHHIEKYEGHFPFWAAIELFTFGSVCSFYKIMKADDKKELSRNCYQCKPKYLQSWILCLLEVRNICAHYNRLYNFPLKQKPRLFKSEKDLLNDSGINKIFPLLIVLKHLLSGNQTWEDFTESLFDLIKTNLDVINLDFMAFPSNWQEILS